MGPCSTQTGIGRLTGGALCYCRRAKKGCKYLLVRRVNRGVALVPVGGNVQG